MHRTTWKVLLVAALAALAGCSKDKLTEMVDEAKQQVSENVDKASQAVQEKAKAAGGAAAAAGNSAQQQLGLAGSMEFTLDAPVKTKGCYVLFLAGRGGRPSVLQLRSYAAADQEAFPSALIQAQTEAASLNELVGKTVAAQTFVQAEPSGPVWHTIGAQPLQLTIKAVADKQLTAELTGSAVNTATGQSAPVSGKIDGYLE
jgi:hypothetical protein